MTGPDGKTYTAKTDANGNATFDGLCPGTYTLSSGNTAGTKQDPVKVQMGCNDKKEVKLRIGSAPPPPPPPPPPSDSCCHGHVTLHVYDQNGNPVAGAVVTLKGSDGSVHQAKTDANGNAIFDGLCPGKYSISANTNNTSTAQTLSFEMGCNDKKEFKMQLASQPPPPPPPSDSCCNGVMAVHVVDANGAPVPNAPVQMTGSDGKMYSATTDASGTAYFKHLCPGRYVIHAATQNSTGGTTSDEEVVVMGCDDHQDTRITVSATR